MFVRLNRKPAQTILVLTLLGLFAIGPTRAWADGIDEFAIPSSGYLSIQFIGGSGGAGGVTNFGLGTAPSNFVPLFTVFFNGGTNPPMSVINLGFFSKGTVIQMGMFSTSAGASGWAFSTGTDQASIVAFSDIDNSLGLGGSSMQQTGRGTWILHLDDAQSYKYDDDDNELLLRLRVTSQPISPVPEPASGLLLLSGCALVTWKARRRS